MRTKINNTVLIVTLLGAVGSWLLTSSSRNWVDLTSPASIGGLFAAVSSVTLAAFGVNAKDDKDEPTE